MSNTRNWLAANNCFMRHGDTRVITHLLMNGGKVHVKKRHSDAFHEMSAKDVKEKKHNFISENRTNNFPMFFDLDFHDVAEIPNARLLDCVEVIRASVAGFFPDADASILIAETTSKTVQVKGQPYIKTGVHLHFPNLIVNKKRACKIRKGCLQKLENRFGKRNDVDPWHKVLDECVFADNGLRMIGSSKTTRCTDCRGPRKKDDFCPKCNNSRKTDENRIYLVTSYRDGNFEELPLPGLLESIKLCSVRSQKEPSSFAVPDWYDEFYFVGVSDETMKAKRKQHSNNEEFDEDKQALKKHKVVGEKTDIGFRKRLRTMLRKNLPDVYKDVEITSIRKCSSDNGVGYYLISTPHTYCYNKCDYHGSNTIFFLINQYGMYVKCHCRCPVERKFGTCAKYCSKCYHIEPELRKELFPSLIAYEIGGGTNQLKEAEAMLFMLQEKTGNRSRI